MHTLAAVFALARTEPRDRAVTLTDADEEPANGVDETPGEAEA